MFQKILIFTFFLFFSGIRAQINYDTISAYIKLESEPRKKFNVFLKVTDKATLTINDYEKLTKTILELGKEEKKESYALVIISSIYHNHNNIDKAIEYADMALKKAETDKDTITLAYANLKIAGCFAEHGNIKKSLTYYRTSILYYDKLKPENSYNKLTEAYNSVGSLFKDKGEFDSSLFYHKKSLELAIKLKNRKQQAYSYNNIGLVYNKMKNLDKALEFYKMSADIKKEMKDYNSLCGTIINTAAVYKKAKRYEESLKAYETGISMAAEYKRGNFLLTGVNDLADMQRELKDYKSAANNYAKYNRLFDSINKGKEDKKLEEISAKYESEKKDAEILKGRENIKVQQTIINKQKQFNYAIGAGLFLAFISIGVVLRSYRQNKKYSKNLALQQHLTEEKNKEITDSINYAKRIQESLLTSHSLFKENCQDFFIFFKPKDIVSGDFYWANKTKDGFLVMCGDCTGHGVPGAFMSLLGISYLNEIVQQHQVHQPNLIFNALKSKVITNLNQKDEARKDGMDASMIKISGLKLEFACSHNPIWILRNNRIIKFKADKSPIGMGVNDDFTFTHNTESLVAGDCVYLFTDGYADQFGGAKGKKFKAKQLEAKMLEIVNLGMEEQKSKLEEHFNEWIGNQDQVDDVLVIGIRI